MRARPLSTYPAVETRQRRRSRFEASWSSTVELLDRELRHLGAEASTVVLELDVQPGDLRLDGWIRASARPATPRVVLSFESKHGPLRYPCDTFTDWQANVRAIALGLEHLRAVDRYGITRRGEQYRGWAQLPAGIAQPPTHMATDEAVAFIAEHSDCSAEQVRANPTVAYRLAAKCLHPDAGGDAALFQRLALAKQLLDREVAS